MSKKIVNLSEKIREKKLKKVLTETYVNLSDNMDDLENIDEKLDNSFNTENPYFDALNFLQEKTKYKDPIKIIQYYNNQMKPNKPLDFKILSALSIIKDIHKDS